MDLLRRSARKGRPLTAICGFLTLTLLAGVSCGSEQKPADRPAGQVAQADSSPQPWEQATDTLGDAVGFETTFAGWYGDTAVIDELEWFESGETSETFHLLHTDGSYVIWDGDPDSLQQGREVNKYSDSETHEPTVRLQLNLDTLALRAMESGISGLSPTDALPDPVPAEAILVWSGMNGTETDTLVQDSINVGPHYGDAAIEYQPPYISVAELSPHGAALIVAIRIGDEDKFYVFNVTAKSKH